MDGSSENEQNVGVLPWDYVGQPVNWEWDSGGLPTSPSIAIRHTTALPSGRMPGNWGKGYPRGILGTKPITGILGLTAEPWASHDSLLGADLPRTRGSPALCENKSTDYRDKSTEDSIDFLAIGQDSLPPEEDCYWTRGAGMEAWRMDGKGPNSTPITLRSVLGPVELVGAADVSVRGCSCDPECVRPGDVFVVLSAGGREGPLAAYQAVAKGAIAVVADAFLPELGVPLCIVPNPVAAYAALSHALAGSPSQALGLIGCVGARTALAAQVFLQAVLAPEVGEVAAAKLLVDFEGAIPSKPVENAGGGAIAGWLREVLSRGYQRAILAFPPEAITDGWLAGLHFETLCFEAPRPNGNGNGRFPRKLPSREEWLRLLDQLSPTGFAVVERGDPNTEAILDCLDVPTLTVGLGTAGEISGTLVESSLSGQTLLVKAGGEAAAVYLRPIGEYATRGFLIAAAVALAEGIPLPEVVRRAEAVTILPGMLEPVCCGQPFAVLVDHPRSWDDIAATLRQLRIVTSGRLLCVLGLEREAPAREPSGSAGIFQPVLAANCLRGCADLIFVHLNGHRSQVGKTFSPQDRRMRWSKEPGWIAADGSGLCGQMYIFEHRQVAIEQALRVARAGDTLLIISTGLFGSELNGAGSFWPAGAEPRNKLKFRSDARRRAA